MTFTHNGSYQRQWQANRQRTLTDIALHMPSKQGTDSMQEESEHWSLHKEASALRCTFGRRTWVDVEEKAVLQCYINKQRVSHIMRTFYNRRGPRCTPGMVRTCTLVVISYRFSAWRLSIIVRAHADSETYVFQTRRLTNIPSCSNCGTTRICTHLV